MGGARRLVAKRKGKDGLPLAVVTLDELNHGIIVTEVVIDRHFTTKYSNLKCG